MSKIITEEIKAKTLQQMHDLLDGKIDKLDVFTCRECKYATPVEDMAMDNICIDCVGNI